MHERIPVEIQKSALSLETVRKELMESNIQSVSNSENLESASKRKIGWFRHPKIHCSLDTSVEVFWEEDEHKAAISYLHSTNT